MIDWERDAASSLPSRCVWLYPQNCSFYIPQIHWIDVCTWLSARWQHRWSLEWLDDETAPTHSKHGLAGKIVYVFSFLTMNLSWVSGNHHLLVYEGIAQTISKVCNWAMISDWFVENLTRKLTSGWKEEKILLGKRCWTATTDCVIKCWKLKWCW